MKDTQKITTNVMRILAKMGIPFVSHSYKADQSLTASEMAALLGKEPQRLFKTLVTRGRSGCCVFMVPADASLNLKKAAAAAGEKSLEMLPQKELLPLTGYVHGGCSPIGMKKEYPVYIDQSCRNFDTIVFSAGKVGFQVELDSRLLPYPTADIADRT